MADFDTNIAVAHFVSDDQNTIERLKKALVLVGQHKPLACFQGKLLFQPTDRQINGDKNDVNILQHTPDTPAPTVTEN